MTFTGRWRNAILIASLAGGVLLSFQASAQEKFKAVTTFTVIADMAKNVAGDVAEVESITKPGAEIHEYQPTPGDIKRAQGAKLILANGMNLELWFQKFYQHLKGVPEVVVTRGITPVAIGNGPYQGKPNPHAWMSPDNAMIYVDNIRDAFIQYDPANAGTYRANAQRYKEKIAVTLAPLHQKLDELPAGQRWLVTSEGAFSYLARDMGLKELYLWPINADQQGTPQQVRNVVDTIKRENIPTIFSESTVSDKPARQVARETGAHYGGVLYVDSLSSADGPVPTYIDLLRVTTDTIVTGIREGAAP
ncbi:metal ABC transporter substrate-binding protein [Atlantibacter hermannii]|uniref:metal ABC transporter substrate-binding protein n=1 Tax=Atlantibacter hermannii TaxID=565 RepID=UPI0011CDE602|nr:metal ABC transporter substrate-binding protein [Atlantibacter hermannii]